MNPLIPTTHYEIRFEQRHAVFAFELEARQPSAYTLKIWEDHFACIAEWQAWRGEHPGPGTMARLKVSARWLQPVLVGVGAAL